MVDTPKIIFVDFPGLRARGIVFSNVHLQRLERAGKFPRRVQISAGRIAWIESELDAWAATRVTQRDSTAPAGGDDLCGAGASQPELAAARSGDR
ncbi:MAG: AlpA family phage regulatory protein [Rhodospirillales bacterium]